MKTKSKLPYIKSVTSDDYDGHPVVILNCPKCWHKITIPQEPTINNCPFCHHRFIVIDDGDAFLFYDVGELRCVRWNDEFEYIG